MTKEEVLETKAAVELALQQANRHAKLLADEGFQVVQINPEGEIYLCRNVTEEYGTRPTPPQSTPGTDTVSAPAPEEPTNPCEEVSN